MTDRQHILDSLFQTIESRKGADPDTSWTAKLFSKGRGKIAQKVGEEAVETVIEATADRRDGMVSESADLLYHLMVLLADAGIDPQEVWDELARREGISGITEKNARTES